MIDLANWLGSLGHFGGIQLPYQLFLASKQVAQMSNASPPRLLKIFLVRPRPCKILTLVPCKLSEIREIVESDISRDLI